jgi:hypothetical protein
MSSESWSTTTTLSACSVFLLLLAIGFVYVLLLAIGFVYVLLLAIGFVYVLYKADQFSFYKLPLLDIFGPPKPSSSPQPCSWNGWPIMGTRECLT